MAQSEKITNRTGAMRTFTCIHATPSLDRHRPQSPRSDRGIHVEDDVEFEDFTQPIPRPCRFTRIWDWGTTTATNIGPKMSPWVCILFFFVHFKNFALQEKVTTPFV